MKRITLLGTVFVVGLVAVGLAVAGANRNWSTHANGSMEVPANSSLGQGQAIFHLSKAGDSLGFELIAANIENVTQAHIHCGPPGVNGPIVVFLYGFGPTVSPNGVLSQGTITNSNVIARPDSAACPGGVSTLDDVLEKMANGGAYVNIHTVALPPGEIRGDIR